MAIKLLNDNQLNYKNLEINLEDIHLKKPISNVFLYQMNPENTDKHKINGFSHVVIDGLSIKKNSIIQVMKNIVHLIRPNENCTIFVI
jgi:hypothetical protein